jgi:hypothetical protein
MTKLIYIEEADKPLTMRKPSTAGLSAEQLLAEANTDSVAQPSGESNQEEGAAPLNKVTFINAWCLPNVFLYASAFFWTKFAVYAIMYNLPEFLKDVYHFDSNQ